MNNVVIYSTPTCHFCHLAKDFMNENNVAFEDVDLASNPDRVQELRDLTGGQTAVPVIKVGDEVIIGFQQAKLEDLLKIGKTDVADSE